MILRACACTLLASSQPHVLGDDTAIPGTMEALEQIWRERGSKVRTLHAVMQIKQWLARGSQPPPDDAEPGTPFPSEDTSLELEAEFWLDGPQWRVDRRGTIWHQPAGRFVESRHVELIDEDSELHFYGTEGAANDDYPQAFLYPLEGKYSAGPGGIDPVSLPWLLRYRDEHPHFQGVRAPDWRLGNDRAVIDGRECYAAEKIVPDGIDVFARSWIDPTRGHAVVRREMGTSHVVVQNLTIVYRADPVYGWVPSEWNAVYQALADNGSIVMTESTSYAIQSLDINEELEGEPFRFKLPEGTLVHDQTRGPPITRYVVEANQAERLVTKQEEARGVTYLDLRTTPSGEAGRPVRPDGRKWWVWAMGVLIAVAAGSWLVRRRT
jgi:hypothetical protein